MPTLETEPEKVETTPVQTPDKPETTKEPDPFLEEGESKEQSESAKKMAKLEAERNEAKAEAERLERERAELDQKYKTAQGRLKESAKLQAPESRPAKTWEQYESELAKEFDADPKGAFFKVLRDTAQDMALRDIQYQKQIKEAEERAFRRALAVDPERGKLVAKINEFDEENPDLAGLSVERKLQFMQLTGKSDKREHRGNEPEPDIATDVSLDGNDGNGRGKVEAWTTDPAVLKEARQAFANKQELLLWANHPEKARALMRQRRNQQ